MTATGLTFGCYGGADRMRSAALGFLLRDIFQLDLEPMERFSGWDPTSRSFSYFDGSGACVANVSAFMMPLSLRGQPRPSVGIQSVAVQPAWRGRGLFRDLMRRAMDWAETQASLALLTTESPGLYEPFGFRLVPEHGFFGPPPAAVGAPASRRLELESAADRALLLGLFRGRAPVSDRFGLYNQAEMFPLMLREVPGSELHLLPGLGVAVATAWEGERWRLLDVVGHGIPSLAALLGALDVAPAEVEVCFAPDKLDWAGQPRHLADKIGFMARGEFLTAGEPFALPPTAAF